MSETQGNGATTAPKYCRVYSTRGNILADLLPEDDAKRFRQQWNKINSREGLPKAIVKPLIVIEYPERR